MTRASTSLSKLLVAQLLIIFNWIFNVHLDDLYDLELNISNHVLIMTGGQIAELPIHEALSKSLILLWEQTGIENIEH